MCIFLLWKRGFRYSTLSKVFCFLGLVFFPILLSFQNCSLPGATQCEKQPSRWCAAKFVDDRLESDLFMRRSGNSSTPPARL